MRTPKRPPIEGGFRISVIAERDIQYPDRLTIPTIITGDLREVASSNTRGDVGAALWAFKSKRERVAVANRLRRLAEFIETNGEMEKYTEEQR